MLATASGLDDVIQSALARSPYRSIRQLQFEVSDGHVTLHGTVLSYYEKQMAQEIVRQLDDVVSVANHVRVQAPRPR